MINAPVTQLTRKQDQTGRRSPLAKEMSAKCVSEREKKRERERERERENERKKIVSIL